MLHDSARTPKLEVYLIGRLQFYECFLLLRNEQRSFEMTLNSGTKRGHRDSSETNKVVEKLWNVFLCHKVINLLKMQCDKVHRHDAESWLASHE